MYYDADFKTLFSVVENSLNELNNVRICVDSLQDSFEPILKLVNSASCEFDVIVVCTEENSEIDIFNKLSAVLENIDIDCFANFLKKICDNVVRMSFVVLPNSYIKSCNYVSSRKCDGSYSDAFILENSHVGSKSVCLYEGLLLNNATFWNEFTILIENNAYINDRYDFREIIQGNVGQEETHENIIKVSKYFEPKMEMMLIKPRQIKLFDYQKAAVDRWIDNDYKGLFDMATGTGKTITAMHAISTLIREKDNKVSVFIVCPYKHLVDQWEEDIVSWGGNPIVCHSDAPDRKWEEKLVRAYKRFKQNEKPFICITTNRSFAGESIQRIFNNIDSSMEILLIVDEVHNFGAKSLNSMLPKNVKYRIGLSATIERHGDEEGTELITRYFGEKCISYGIEEAINDGKALCPYEYHPILVYLTEDEKEKYQELSRRLKDYIFYEEKRTYISEAGKVILYERARVLAGAKEKKHKLKELIEPYSNQHNILVYCGATIDQDTGKRQIDAVTDMLNEDMGIVTHKFTAEETGAERQNIKQFFREGLYQVITAIKCLDEGVNIPGIETAFILSSGRNPREYVQRRGRLLRKSEGKERAIIYDFVVLPTALSKLRFGEFETDKSIVLGELNRVRDFANLSINSIEGEELINDVLEAYGVDEGIDELLLSMEGFEDE